jgi:hypothetical protein
MASSALSWPNAVEDGDERPVRETAATRSPGSRLLGGMDSWQ